MQDIPDCQVREVAGILFAERGSDVSAHEIWIKPFDYTGTRRPREKRPTTLREIYKNTGKVIYCLTLFNN